MADFETTKEKQGWEEAAAENGVVLSSVDLNDTEDMKELYHILGVNGVAAKSRLRAHIKSLQGPQQLGGDIVAEMQAMRLEIHGVRETLQSVLVGQVITPSQASRIPQVVSSVFDSLGLSLTPRADAEQYDLPTSCGDEWKFSWKWRSGKKYG